MRKFLFLIFIFSTVLAKAQNASVVVEYREMVDLNLVHRNLKSYQGNLATLQASGSESIYVKDKLKANEVYKSNLPSKEEAMKMAMSGNITISLNSYSDSIGQVLYKDHAQKKIIERKFFSQFPRDKGDPRIYEESLPAMVWQLKGETKTIGKFVCQKATTRFRGRNYTAWFAPEIPINAGPWKFHGLAGLILEVYDDTKRVQFLFESITYPADVPKLTATPFNSGKKITFDDYKFSCSMEGLEKIAEERSKAQQALMGNRNVSVTMTPGESEFIEKEFEKRP